MNKLKLLFVLIIITFLLTGCSTVKIDHSDKSIVQMQVEDKTVDEDYITVIDKHYIIELSYKDSMYVIKNETIFNSVKVLDNIDVIYTINYDAEDNIISAYIEPVMQKE